MARLPIQSVETATGTNQAIFAATEKSMGKVPNMMKVMANSPAVLQAYIKFSGALGGTGLSPALRQQLALLSAQVNGCAYCLSAHTLMGQGAGLSQGEVSAARRGESADLRARAALAFAKEVLERRGGVSVDRVEAVRAAGFSDAEIAEIIALLALNAFSNLFNRAFEVDLDFPHVEVYPA